MRIGCYDALPKGNAVYVAQLGRDGDAREQLDRINRDVPRFGCQRKSFAIREMECSTAFFQSDLQLLAR